MGVNVLGGIYSKIKMELYLCFCLSHVCVMPSECYACDKIGHTLGVFFFFFFFFFFANLCLQFNELRFRV